MPSSYQTLSNVYTDVRGLSGKDSTTLPDTVLLPIANKYFSLLVRELIGLNEDIYAEISSTDLESDQREYALPIDDTTGAGDNGIYGGGLIKLLRVEISYDGTNWMVADPISLQEMNNPTMLDSDINASFSQGDPKYWFKDRSVWVAPIPVSTDDVAEDNNNLRIYWIKRPNEMTSSAAVPGIPKDFLGILSEGMLYDIYRRFGRTSDARDALQNWHLGIAKMRELEQNIDTEQVYRMRAITKNYK